MKTSDVGWAVYWSAQSSTPALLVTSKQSIGKKVDWAIHAEQSEKTTVRSEGVYLLFTGHRIWMNADPSLRSTVNLFFQSVPLVISETLGDRLMEIRVVVCVHTVPAWC